MPGTPFDRLRDASSLATTYINEAELETIAQGLYDGANVFISHFASEQHKAHIRAAKPALDEQLLILAGYDEPALASLAAEIREAVIIIDRLCWRLREELREGL